MADESLLRAANDAFYQAFRDRDREAMERLWARRRPLLCAHPGARPLYEYRAVLDSWAGILGNPNCPRLEYRIERILHWGELALLSCYEWTRAQPDALLLATNGFVFEEGAYRMVIHQAGPVRGLVLSGGPETGTRLH
ncbi:MAG: nuclear transport factor 2 family protein [Pseudomonadota bacterium]|jgi:hypothetical protein